MAALVSGADILTGDTADFRALLSDQRRVTIVLL